jgi:predicted DsbA family dithiol-disulfide isomerase
MRIDFVSDVACPWCAVGLNALERALERIGPDIPVELHFQPFELNPTMAAEGADAADYLKANERGALVGFTFGNRARVWNTFDAHRLLHWAGLQDQQAAAAQQPAGKQRALKHALLTAYHGEGRNPGAQDVLLDLVTQVGLDAQDASAVLADGRYADEVRAAEQEWQQAGINSVPAIVINQRHLISGGQPPDVFEQALRQIAKEAA